MSGNTWAAYGYGYIVTQKEYFNLESEDWDRFIDSPYTICIDRNADEPIYFFGIYKAIDEGEYMQLSIADSTFKPDMTSYMVKEYRQIFPNLAGDNPYFARYYLLSIILD